MLIFYMIKILTLIQCTFITHLTIFAKYHIVQLKAITLLTNALLTNLEGLTDQTKMKIFICSRIQLKHKS